MKSIWGIILMSLILTVSSGESVWAASSLERVTVWNRMGDWFATVGKSDREKRKIVADRKAYRREVRASNKIYKENKKLQKRMRKQQEAILEGVHTRKAPHGRGGIDAPPQ